MLRFQHRFLLFFAACLLAAAGTSHAQGDVKVSARTDAAQISVGDRARIFLEVAHNPATSRIDWAAIPDSLDHLEIAEKGKIDTIKNGSLVTYRQRLLVTGFDSGLYTVPSFSFPVIPQNGTPYVLHTDSISLLVQTVPVDTTKPFKPIKGIIAVKSSWLDYIWLIIGCVLFLGLALFVVLYFRKHKAVKAPVTPAAPAETLQEKALKLLAALEAEQLWQNGQVKAYYIRLTEIVRGYIEARFQTPALELTTDELMEKTRTSRDLIPVAAQLHTILHTADLAKFARAEPLPAEHLAAMTAAKDLITATPPPPVAPEPPKQS